MKDKIIKLLYKYRIDFSTEPNYTDFGIAEDKFDVLANDIETLIDDIIEDNKKSDDLATFNSED